MAARLRQLLQEDPSRCASSLLITGHSAGGAVAALLYAHMLLTSPSGPAASELNALAGCFRRVHCVTFGAPPVSLLPLTRPENGVSGDGGDGNDNDAGGDDDASRRRRRRRLDLAKGSLFLSFVNEGDPVARADKAYVRSLLELFARPAPPTAATTGKGDRPKPPSSSLLLPACPKQQNRSSSRMSVVSTRSSRSAGKTSKTKGSRKKDRDSTSPSPSGPASHAGPVWKVPPSTLSNAGRIVVLRSGDPGASLKGKKTVEERLNEGVVAQVATDEQLRGVVWGNPVCHLMKLYAGRLEILAVGAVTAKDY